MRYILLFIIQLVAFPLWAQKVIYKQDFENINNYIIPGWNSNTYSGKVPWSAGPMYLVSGDCLCAKLPNSVSYNYVAGISDCGKFDYDNSNVLTYTPRIDFTGHPNVYLKFDSYFPKYTDGLHTEKATVEVSTNGGANWDVVADLSGNPNSAAFTTIAINLSVYNTFNDVRIGFRYSDGKGHTAGWAIDNVEVFEPVNKDLQLNSVSPTDSLASYAALNTGLKHVFTVSNAGLDTVKAFTISYQQETFGIQTDSIDNVIIPPFQSALYVHPFADTVMSSGRHPVTAWVNLPGDTLRWNDTVKTAINGAYFMPQKIVTVEEGTGTWCAYCIPGIVYMKQLKQSNGYYACPVSVHDADPMVTTLIAPYNQYLFDIDQNYTPYFLLDRRYRVINPDSLLNDVLKRQAYFGYADINIDPKLDGNAFSVWVNVTPAIDLHGDYRLVLVVTEDDVTGSGLGWDQANAFANNALGRPMGGFENRPDPVLAKDMQYQYVARGIYPSPQGVTNLPGSMAHGQAYPAHFDAVLDPSWNKDKLRANVFLIRQDDSMILNSNKILFYLDVKDKAAPFTDAFIYPNPAAEQANVRFSTSETGEVTIQLTDISGRVLSDDGTHSYDAGKHNVHFDTRNLSAGIYFINLVSDHGRKALKLQVIR